MSEDHKGASTLVNIGMIIAIMLLIVVGGWFLLRPAIMWISFYCSYYMFGVYTHLSWLMTQAEMSSIVTARQFIPKMKPTNYGIMSFLHLCELHGYVLRWLFVPGLIFWGWKVKTGVVRFRYRRKFKDVYELIEEQSKNFPASAIIYGKNLLNLHPYDGPRATYALPVDFALDCGVLWISKQPVEADAIVDKTKMLRIPAFNLKQKTLSFPKKRKLLPHYQYVVYDALQANEHFKSQMSEPWGGFNSLPPLERALYAIFVTQGSGEWSKAWEMIEQIAFSFKEATYDKQWNAITPHTANLKGVDELLEKYANHPKALEIIAGHHHTINVMTETLAWARAKGRLVHANIGWLKPVNRTLWYALCGQGGQCPYWEAAGPHAHALVEKKMGKRIATPMVLGAVDELKRYMSMEHWIDPGEYGEEHQRRLVKEANAVLDSEKERREQAQKNKNRPGGMAIQVPQRKAVVIPGDEDDTP